ncbi:MAG TPA: DUF1634 domain-containing protein [Dehalococcoidia bacterium]|nr:DUF1634 domain-containing protein [Dehalococcoidia bacterium]
MPDEAPFLPASEENPAPVATPSVAVVHAPPGSSNMELWISHVLRWGVVMAAIVLLIGSAVFLVSGPAPRDPHSFSQLVHKQYSNRSSVQAKVTGLKHLRGLEIVDLGLMLLILTPVIRVAMTFVLFFRLKDWKFTLVTAIVLSILLLGISGAGV